jgi:hypothetical protein
LSHGPDFPHPELLPELQASPTSFGSGGSFLGTAASVAAGVIGGELLRSMFGHRSDSAGSNSSVSGGRGQDSALATDDAFETNDTDDDENFADENFADDDSYDV